MRGGTADLTDDLQARLVGHRANAFGFTGLARTQDLGGMPDGGQLQTARPDLESLMLYYDLEAAR